ncbi:MAG TPA: twin-arginine translocase TatA/TatE family subunit [Candidatus Polarisedimenticolaceae bacterium]|nr:twin-arginine translocase TatA/TatE family subunit [Candidatus Polarisedimenticolaceae bacterium]
MAPLALFGTFGFQELLLILLILLVLFGGRRIPEIARGLGEGIRNFKEAMRGDEHKTDKKPPSP